MPDLTVTIVKENHNCRAAPVALRFKRLALGTMLLVIGAAFSVSACAADINNINRAAAMEKQRNLNKINLAKVRHFDRRAKHTNSLKLDALPQSPRRGAYAVSTNTMQTVATGARARKNNSVVQAAAD